MQMCPGFNSRRLQAFSSIFASYNIQILLISFQEYSKSNRTHTFHVTMKLVSQFTVKMMLYAKHCEDGAHTNIYCGESNKRDMLAYVHRNSEVNVRLNFFSEPCFTIHWLLKMKFRKSCSFLLTSGCHTSNISNTLFLSSPLLSLHSCHTVCT